MTHTMIFKFYLQLEKREKEKEENRYNPLIPNKSAE